MRNVRAIKLAGVQPRDPASAVMFGWNDTLSGVDVNENTAFNISAFWNGIQMIAGSFASSEAQYLEREEATKSWVHREEDTLGNLVKFCPNPEMTAYSFFESFLSHALSWGNAYAEIEFDGNLNPTGLWPLTPNRVTPMRDKQGALYYSVLCDGVSKPLAPEQVLHVPGLGYDGLIGYNVVRTARQSLGLTSATEQYGAAFFGNGTHPNGILTTDQRLNDQAVENIRECWNYKHEGLSRAHRTAILHSGYTFKQIAVNPGDIQFLESRKFQIEEIARWLNIPPHLLKHLDRSTNNNIEHQSLEYVTYTLRPWKVRVCQELLRKLVKPALWYQRRFDFDMEALTRGDFLSFMKALYIGRQASLFNADECRAKLNMNPQPNGLGQEYIKPVNYVGVEDGETGVLQPGIAK